jgi:hypothetical protein
MDSEKMGRQRAEEGGRASVQRREDAPGFVDGRTSTAQLAEQQARADASPRAAQLREIAALADAAPVQRMSEDDDEREAAVQRKEDAGARNETGMPDGLKAGIEALSGLDMSAVRVHRNSDKPAQLSAHAYAQGTDIHLAPGQERHLPHEAWHVVQQMQGRVRPTTQMKEQGVPINDDDTLEREADLMGEQALR